MNTGIRHLLSIAGLALIFGAGNQLAGAHTSLPGDPTLKIR